MFFLSYKQEINVRSRVEDIKYGRVQRRKGVGEQWWYGRHGFQLFVIFGTFSSFVYISTVFRYFFNRSIMCVSESIFRWRSVLSHAAGYATIWLGRSHLYRAGAWDALHLVVSGFGMTSLATRKKAWTILRVKVAVQLDVNTTRNKKGPKFENNLITAYIVSTFSFVVARSNTDQATTSWI